MHTLHAQDYLVVLCNLYRYTLSCIILCCFSCCFNSATSLVVLWFEPNISYLRNFYLCFNRTKILVFLVTALLILLLVTFAEFMSCECIDCLGSNWRKSVTDSSQLGTDLIWRACWILVREPAGSFEGESTGCPKGILDISKFFWALMRMLSYLLVGILFKN